jgi:outer membrane biosynthesis protein TonB
MPIALTTASLVIFVAAALLALPSTKPDQAVAADTDAPTANVPAVALGSEPPTSIDPTAGQGPTDQPAPSSEPTTTGGGGPGPTAPPGPGSTPRPPRGTGATPKPTRPGGTPTPAPTPTPTPTPTVPPTDTPTPGCTVITLINHWTFNAQHQWATAGFTGTVIFNPAPPPDYHIKWQSLAIGAVVPCSSDITVSDTAP